MFEYLSAFTNSFKKFPKKIRNEKHISFSLKENNQNSPFYSH